MGAFSGGLFTCVDRYKSPRGCLSMRKTLTKLLAKAEKAPGWNKNTKGPWTPIAELLSTELRTDVHAAKIQRSSARKSLWQGRLHRSPPIRCLFLASDQPCDEKAFETLSKSVEERFGPPTTWADACLIVSDGELIGCIERDGVGLADWISSGRHDIETAKCSSHSSQIELVKLVQDSFTPARFVKELETRARKGDGIKDFLVAAFKVKPKEVLVSSAATPSNAAKSRWEGADMDPSIRYRIAVVATSDWDWMSAVEEVMHRMDPPDLSLDFALLAAKSKANGPWNQFRAFVRKDGASTDFFKRVIDLGEIHDVREVEARFVVGKTYERKNPWQDSELRVRDSDAGDISYEVSRPKRRIHDFLTNSLRDWARQQKLLVLEGSDSISMYDALVKREKEGDLLIEVKTSAEPGVVRLAIGQLIDYRRVLEAEGKIIKCESILLLPSGERPESEMIALLAHVQLSWATLRYKGRGAKAKMVLEIHGPEGKTYSIP